MSAQFLDRSRRDFLCNSLKSVAGLSVATQLSGSLAGAPSDRFELSIHQFSVKKLIDNGQLDTAGYPAFVKDQFGFTNVEFAVDFCGELFQEPAKGEAIRARSEKLGIKHRVLLCGSEPLDAASATDRQSALEAHLQWAKVATHLGCEFMRVRAASEGDKSRQLEHATKGIGALCDALKDSPVSILLENITNCSSDPDWLVELVNRVGQERVGLIADFGNFEGDIYEGMRRLLPVTKSVCTKSWEFDSDGNETKIDFKRMVAIVKQSPFHGCIAIEYLGADPIHGVQQTAALINKYS
ncbi:MAG: TIM barrel protein [Planctomycetales bacterium]|nr:TIM barrel protein [Planctomycetales bacterium]